MNAEAPKRSHSLQPKEGFLFRGGENVYYPKLAEIDDVAQVLESGKEALIRAGGSKKIMGGPRSVYAWLPGVGGVSFSEQTTIDDFTQAIEQKRERRKAEKALLDPIIEGLSEQQYEKLRKFLAPYMDGNFYATKANDSVAAFIEVADEDQLRQIRDSKDYFI